jgi:hypothetical protein
LNAEAPLFLSVTLLTGLKTLNETLLCSNPEHTFSFEAVHGLLVAPVIGPFILNRQDQFGTALNAQ